MLPLQLHLKQLKKTSSLIQNTEKKLNLYRKSKNDPQYIFAYKAKSKEYGQGVRKWYDDLETSICKNPTNAK